MSIGKPLYLKNQSMILSSRKAVFIFLQTKKKYIQVMAKRAEDTQHHARVLTTKLSNNIN